VDETIRIAKEGNLPAEIYHMKLSGVDNWSKLDAMIAKIEKANQEGIRITADMYTYPAGATGLDAAMPPWVQEGGLNAWIKRLKDPSIRKKVLQEMRTKTDKWENLMMLAGDPERKYCCSGSPMILFAKILLVKHWVRWLRFTESLRKKQLWIW